MNSWFVVLRQTWGGLVSPTLVEPTVYAQAGTSQNQLFCSKPNSFFVPCYIRTTIPSLVFDYM
jgi:hypothetical protein